MAKKVKFNNVSDFLEKTLGMSASAESMRMETSSRRLNSEIYSKPMNPYRLAKNLADIQADQYKQHAESVAATAMSEAAMRGYGELSVQDVTDKVTESAKNAWKSFLVLIDKLISVIKEFIRGLFDKEKKLEGVIKKLKTASKRVKDSSRVDSSKEIKLARLNPILEKFITETRTVSYNPIPRTSTSKTTKTISSAFLLGIISLLDVIKETRKGGGENGETIKKFIVDTLAKAQNITSDATKFGITDYKGDSNIKGEYSNSKLNVDDLDVKEYKEDWNIIINNFTNVQKGIVKNVKTKGKTEGDDNAEKGYTVIKYNRSKASSDNLADQIDNFHRILTKFKEAKINSKLEKCISALNTLRQSIIKNKDGRFSNKYAQLGRITISKLTILYTKSIAMMNTIYAVCFKVAAINISGVNSMRQKDTNKNGKDGDDYDNTANF